VLIVTNADLWIDINEVVGEINKTSPFSNAWAIGRNLWPCRSATGPLGVNQLLSIALRQIAIALI